MNDLLYMPGHYARKLADQLSEIRSAKMKGKAPKQGWDDLFLSRKPLTVDANGIATVSIFGPLGKGLDPIWKLFGSTDYDDLVAEWNQAREDKSIRGVFNDVNSCGGQVLGNPEAAAVLAALTAEKPTVTYTDQIACSAAYGVACAVDEFWAAGSSIVGSIGTICGWYEYSGMIEEAGITPVTFKAGKLKEAGTTDRQPTADEAAFFQATIDEMNAVFSGHVLASRGEVDDSTMQGQWFSGRKAKELNLVDEIGSREEAYASLQYLIS